SSATRRPRRSMPSFVRCSRGAMPSFTRSTIRSESARRTTPRRSGSPANDAICSVSKGDVMDALRAFEVVDFQWTQSLDSIWHDPRYDVPTLHEKERHEVLAKVRSMAESPDTGSPLGWVFVGP